MEKSGIFYKKVEATLNSLKNSTYLSVELRGEKVTCDGLNSPYVSHKTVSVEYGHCIDKLVIFRNGQSFLAVSGDGSHEFSSDDSMIGLVPAHHLRDLFQFPASMPDWMNGLIKVIIPDDFDKFDESGNPVYKNSGRIRIKHLYGGEHEATRTLHEWAYGIE